MDNEGYSFGAQGTDNEKAKQDHVFAHSEDLYDSDTDIGGERINLRTGKPYNNAPTVDALDEKLTKISVRKGKGTDALGDLPKEKDMAAKWLAEEEARLRRSKN